MFHSYGPGRRPGLEALKEQGVGRRPAGGARRRVARVPLLNSVDADDVDCLSSLVRYMSECGGTLTVVKGGEEISEIVSHTRLEAWNMYNTRSRNAKVHADDPVAESGVTVLRGRDHF